MYKQNNKGNVSLTIYTYIIIFKYISSTYQGQLDKINMETSSDDIIQLYIILVLSIR